MLPNIVENVFQRSPGLLFSIYSNSAYIKKYGDEFKYAYLHMESA